MPLSRVVVLLGLLLGVALFFACPGPGEPNHGQDGGPGTDAGVDGGQDAGGVDAGGTGAGGSDAGGADAGGADAGGTDAGGGNGGSDGGADAGSPNPAISASDQTLTLTTQVGVGPVTSAGPGWVVIYADDGSGGLGAVIGHAAVANGTTGSVQVPLDLRASNGALLHAVLHTDQGTVGAFEYPGVDAQVTNNGTPVAAAFTVTVQAGTPDLLLTLSSQSFSGFVWQGVTPSTYQAQTIGAGSLNQSLTLMAGWRYKVNNQVAASHPLEFLQVGASGDTVLLSQAAVGTLESDSSIAWQELSSTTAVFTVSASLQSALNGYRCNIHTSTMRGAISVQ